MILTAVLLVFGFWPQPMLDVVHQGVKPLVTRLDAGREAKERDTRNVRLEPGPGAETTDGSSTHGEGR